MARSTDRQDAILADLRAGLRDVEIARCHNVTRQRVNQIRKQHGIPHPPRPERPAPSPKPPDPRRWTEAKLAYLVVHHDESDSDIAAAIGRTTSAVRARRVQLTWEGRIPRRPSRWDAPGTGHGSPLSDADLALIDDPALPASEVAERTGRTLKAIHRLRGLRGVTAVQSPRGGAVHVWTDERIAIVIANADRPLAEVAAMLGISVGAVKHIRTRLIAAGRIERQPTGTRTLSPANQAVLDDLRSGMSIEDVAARHGRSVARVTLMARAYGIDDAAQS